MLKEILLSLSTILLMVPPMMGQWEDISIPVSVTFTSVEFLDTSTGWICGGNEIYKTQDSGESWELVYTDDPAVSIEEVAIISESTLLAIGRNFQSNQSVILRSTDSGLTWSPVENDFFSTLNGIFFIDDSVGFCVGTGAIVIRTEDAGLHWEKMNSGLPGNIFLQSVFFTDSLTGFAVGGWPNINSSCIRTRDGGLNWEPVDLSSDEYMQSVFFINEQIGFIVGWNGEIFVSRDAGITWTPQTSVNMNGNLEIVFTNDSIGYIVGGMMNEASIQKTYNQGLVWEETSPGIPHGLIAIDFPSMDIGYAVGGVGTILRTTNGGVTSLRQVREPLTVTLFPNPVNTTLNIRSDINEITQVSLMDASGKLLYMEKGSGYEMEIDMVKFPPGNYYVHIQQGSNSMVRKIAKM